MNLSVRGGEESINAETAVMKAVAAGIVVVIAPAIARGMPVMNPWGVKRDHGRCHR